jgi:dienelactone hydrolase
VIGIGQLSPEADEWLKTSGEAREEMMIVSVAKFLGSISLALLSALFICQDALAQSFKSFRPSGSGPFPIVIFVSGCSGFVAMGSVNSYDEQAAALQRQGYLVVYADYLRRSGAKDCTAGMTHAKAAAEIGDAAAWAATQKDADPRRISVIGWSYGGGAVLAAMAATNSPPFQKAVLFYPDCRGAAPSRSAVSTLVLFAGMDDVTPPAQCQQVMSAMPPGSVRVTTYPSAKHGFDARGLPSSLRYAHGTVGYDAQVEQAAWAQVRAFLN